MACPDPSRALPGKRRSPATAGKLEQSSDFVARAAPSPWSCTSPLTASKAAGVVALIVRRALPSLVTLSR